METSSLKKNWVLTEEAQDKLLALLHPVRAQAEVEYLRYRDRIIKKLSYMLQLKNSPVLDDLADVAFDRFARRVEEGEEIASVWAYLSGVADKVVKEYWKSVEAKMARTQVTFDELTPGQTPSVDPLEDLAQAEKEFDLNALEKCRETDLTVDERTTLDVYYYGSGRERIERRKALAQKLNKKIEAVRTEVNRLNAVLRDCIRRQRKQQKVL